MDPVTYRSEEITKYLDMADKLHEDAEAVLDHTLTKKQAVETYGINAPYITNKIENLKFQKEFNNQEQNYSLAVRSVLENGWSRNEAVAEYRVTRNILEREIREARRVGIDLYFFNRPINYNYRNSWSYQDEKKILNELKEWKDSGEETRFRQFDIYEKISKLAYQYARAHGKSYPAIWDILQHTTVEWLKEFDMRHHDKIKEIFRNAQV